ncbi:MAG TPA: hypothetical protein VJO99_05735 [Burkholderiaceae bacterium]|nr:hypothetical protein [Burkholderiaceae bacterium]
MRITPDPDPLPTGLGPRIAPARKPAPAAPHTWRPLPGHRGYECDGRSVRRVADSPRAA